MKSKMAKKVIAASLATVMTVGLAACGNEPAPTGGNESTGQSDTVEQSTPEESSGEEQSTPEESSEEEEISSYTVLTDENGNVYDLGGMEIIVRDWWSPAEPAEPQNDYEEARQDYRDWIQATYNFTIKEQAISDWGSAPQDFADYATTGGDENYVFVVRPDAAVTSAMFSGLMYDLSTLDCLDFSEEKWQASGMHELMSFKNAIYGMYAVDNEPRGGVYFNRRLLEEAGINPDDIYTWQENGEWTWDKFTEVLATVQRDTDADGVIDVAGVTANDADIYMEAVWSNNGEFVGQENGEFVYKLESDETLEALNWAWQMIKDYRQVDPEGSNWDYYKNAFINGEVAFCVEQHYCAQPNGQWDTMEDEYGWVCFPMGPKADDYTNLYENNIYVIPACYDAEKAWNIAFAYNLYTEPVPGYEDFAAWKASYMNFGYDEKGLDLTDARLVENGMVTYHDLVGFDMSIKGDMLYSLTSSTVSEKVEEVREKWKNAIDQANNR
ncbi:MAG: extracellular solute-binding protein [Acetatifactor sp.]|nr:extracellular solute-binding protein [Acetatifactor sp.]